MSRVCQFTGARTSTGRTIHYRGLPKYKGGIGLNISGVSRRTFKPNIQRVRALVDGKPVWVKASTKAIKSGLVIKPLKRKYGWTRDQKLQDGGS